MPLETELKFLHPDLPQLTQILKQKKAELLAHHFEENWVFDTPERTLRRGHILLRLRRGDAATLTLKAKPTETVLEDSRFKVLEELETQIDDLSTMRRILNHLGFFITFRYEKLRATWKWQSCLICLDTLPFMQAVEIEGQPEDIEQAATDLGLDNLRTSKANYHQLYLQHRQALGLPPEDDFVFTPDQKALMLAQAGIQ
jgi:adenylate cyclase, class 2